MKSKLMKAEEYEKILKRASRYSTVSFIFI
jgi:hypothetical protein